MSAEDKVDRMDDDETSMDKFNEDLETQVITDNQEYYEIMLVEGPQQETKKIPIKILPSSTNNIKVTSSSIKPTQSMAKIIPIAPKVSNVKPISVARVIKSEPATKIIKKGRKKRPPVIKPIEPVKILPKLPTNGNGNVFQYVDQPRQSKLDQLVEKILREYNNEIDVFFRSMAASVKKLQPNLIPKVKMEVCNVIAKYEMQSYVNQLSSQV